MIRRTLIATIAAIAVLPSAAGAQQVVPGRNQIYRLDGSAARPSDTYELDQDTGRYRIGANNEGFTAGGALRWDFNTTRLNLSDGYCLSFDATGSFCDGGANIIEQRNGTSGQTFYLYRTYTNGGTDYERFGISYQSTVVDLLNQKGGTGTLRPLRFGVQDAQWQISTSGHWLTVTDNTYDIGAAAATRPRTIYAGTNVVVGDVALATTGIVITNGAGTELFFTGASGANIASHTDSDLTLLAGTGRNLNLGANGTNSIMRLNSTGLIFPTDNTYDIGASGATRPRNIYAGTNFVVVDGGQFISQGGTGFKVRSGGDGIIVLRNDADTGFTRMNFGGASSSFPALKRSSTAIEVKLADDSGYAPFGANSYRLNAVTFASAAAPTIGSGFGTSPTVPSNNGTIAFTVNVGTGGTATGGVITMPAATTGWNCSVENRTAVAANRANQRTLQTATTTTSVTVQNQTVSTGAALAWTASDILVFKCAAY